MSLMSYDHALSTATHIGGNAISGATSFELGVGASALGKVWGNKLVNSIGGALQKFGNNIKSNNSQTLIQLKVVFKTVLEILFKNLMVKLKIQPHRILVKIWECMVVKIWVKP